MFLIGTSGEQQPQSSSVLSYSNPVMAVTDNNVETGKRQKQLLLSNR